MFTSVKITILLISDFECQWRTFIPNPLTQLKNNIETNAFGYVKRFVQAYNFISSKRNQFLEMSL